MISIEKSLRHMAWSNQRFFEEIAQLPPSIYGLAAAGGEWPIGQILTHFLNAGEWFRYVLSGTDWTDLTPITNSQTLLESKLYLAELDKALITQAMNQDGEVHITIHRVGIYIQTNRFQDQVTQQRSDLLTIKRMTHEARWQLHIISNLTLHNTDTMTC